MLRRLMHGAYLIYILLYTFLVWWEKIAFKYLPVQDKLQFWILFISASVIFFALGIFIEIMYAHKLEQKNQELLEKLKQLEKQK